MHSLLLPLLKGHLEAIPVQYAKKVVHNRVYGGTQTLPMRVDTGGVMPPILASSLLAAPATFAGFVARRSFLKPYVDTIQQSLSRSASF